MHEIECSDDVRLLPGVNRSNQGLRVPPPYMELSEYFDCSVLDEWAAACGLQRTSDGLRIRENGVYQSARGPHQQVDWPWPDGVL